MNIHNVSTNFVTTSDPVIGWLRGKKEWKSPWFFLCNTAGPMIFTGLPLIFTGIQIFFWHQLDANSWYIMIYCSFYCTLGKLAPNYRVSFLFWDNTEWIIQRSELTSDDKVPDLYSTQVQYILGFQDQNNFTHHPLNTKGTQNFTCISII